MKKQRGQSVVEFAFIVPMFALFLFGLIYGGIMFLEYLNLCNDARAEARRVAVMNSTQRNQFFNVSSSASYPTGENDAKVVTNSDRENEKRLTFGTFYEVKQKFWVTTTTDEETNKTTLEDIIVQVEFDRNNDDLPNVLKWMGWPPEKLKPVYYRMRIEQEIEVKTN